MRPVTTAGERDVWEATEEDQEASLRSKSAKDERGAEEEAVGCDFGRARTFDNPSSHAVRCRTFDDSNSRAEYEKEYRDGKAAGKEVEEAFKCFFLFVFFSLFFFLLFFLG